MVTAGSNVSLQVLVEWSGLPSPLATWAENTALRQCCSPERLGLGSKQSEKEGMLQALPKTLLGVQQGSLKQAGCVEVFGPGSPTFTSPGQGGIGPNTCVCDSSYAGVNKC